MERAQLSEDYVNPFGKGPAAKAAGIRLNHQAFPDNMHIEIDDLIVTGDTAVLRFTLRGTDLGGYAGRPPTGRAVEEWGVNIMRFKNDRVVSEFMGADKLGLFIQLGVIEDPWPRATCGCRKCHPTFWRGTMHIETCRFPPPYDRCSSGTTKSGIVRLRPWDVPAHRQDRVDTLHSFNPFILFTGPDEVFGTHRVHLTGVTASPTGA